MDEPFAKLSVNRPQDASAYQTSMPVNRQTGRPQYGIPLMDGQKPQDLRSF